MTCTKTGNEAAIRARLVERGQLLFDAKKAVLIRFTGDKNADELLNDIVGQAYQRRN